MALLGESFEPWVKDQINLRQEILSNNNAISDSISTISRDGVLLYTLSKAPFIRLTSGVNIDNDSNGEFKIKQLRLPGDVNQYFNEGLASKYVLFSSRFDDEFTTNVNYGFIGPSYGFTSDPDYGLVPPPGITSIDVRALNRGSLREATINIICHNLSQFKIIDTLFLKLRYSLLLEWGHTEYFNNDYTLASPLNIPNISNDFLKKTFTQEGLLDRIENEREKSSGNYDAFFGIVKNFDWELQENGSYRITVKVISTGDIIESLKVNTNYPFTSTTDNISPIFLKSTLHKILGDIKTKINDGGPGAAGYLNGFKYSPEDNALDTRTISAFTGFLYNFIRSGDNQNVTFPNEDLTTNEGFRVWFDNLEILVDENGNEQAANQYYIKLGTLLRILESFLIYYDSTKTDSENSNPPVFKIDHNYDTNFCLTTPTHLSVDPRVCVIPLSYNYELNKTLVGEYRKITETRELYWDRIDKKWKVSAGGPSELEEFLDESQLPEGYVLDQTTLLGVTTNVDNLNFEKQVIKNPTIGSRSTETVNLDENDENDLSNLKKQIKDILLSINQNITPGVDLGPFIDSKLNVIPNSSLESTKQITRAEPISSTVAGVQESIADVLDLPSSTVGLSSNIQSVTVTISRVLTGRIQISSVRYDRNPNAEAQTAAILQNQTDNQVGGDKLFRSTDDALKAKTMHIQVNIGYILKILDNNIDDDGNISIYDFLKELVSGIKTSLCSINDFEIIYTESTNTFSIIDNSLLASLYNNTEPVRFNINLLKSSIQDPNSSNSFIQGIGSFITNFSLKTELFSRIANTIAIGAQANGNTTISNSTAFSEFNKALTDRILTTKTNKNDPSLDDNGINVKFKQLYANYIKFRTNYTNRVITDSDISAAQSYVKSIIEYELGIYTNKKRIPGVGFIPLNLQLTMDGLSGMKIYETFDIDETLLPTEYQNRIRFIIRGVNHKVDNYKWETSIETLSLPKENNINLAVPLQLPNDIPPTRTSSTASTSLKGSTNANKLRAIIKELNYSEKGNQLDSSGYDILESTYSTAERFLRDLKQRYPSYNIQFTAGNDTYHLENSPTSTHVKGKALDIKIEGVVNRVTNPTEENATVNGSYTPEEKTKINNIISIARNYFGRVLDEYQFPSKKATGGHIHMNI